VSVLALSYLFLVSCQLLIPYLSTLPMTLAEAQSLNMALLHRSHCLSHSVDFSAFVNSFEAVVVHSLRSSVDSLIYTSDYYLLQAQNRPTPLLLLLQRKHSSPTLMCSRAMS
jgi:hypothetical protein